MNPPNLQVYTVVDEMFLAGEIRETSQNKVLKQLMSLQTLEWYYSTQTRLIYYYLPASSY